MLVDSSVTAVTNGGYLWCSRYGERPKRSTIRRRTRSSHGVTPDVPWAGTAGVLAALLAFMVLPLSVLPPASGALPTSGSHARPIGLRSPTCGRSSPILRGADRFVKDIQDLWDHARVEMAQVIRTRRAELGMSQAQLAAAAGIDSRQIRRYESGDQQPMLSVAVAIAHALGITVGQLAGEPTQRLTLAGDWWASWQTFMEGREIITVQEVRFTQRGDDLRVEAVTRGLSMEEGGYLWRGELRLWDNEVLMGWYAANDQSTRSKGTMYFVIHPHGQSMSGRWVGLSYDGAIVSGWASMAKTEEEAGRRVQDLMDRPGVSS